MPYDAALIGDLRRVASMQNDHLRAATMLLIEHSVWLGRGEFVAAAVADRGSGPVISWQGARKFLGTTPCGTASELAILDLAVAIGQDRYRLSVMDHADAAWAGRAVAGALGEAVYDD